MTEAVTVALIVATGPVVTGAVTIVQTKRANARLGEIHVLVNSRLSTALDEIKQLKGVISRQSDNQADT